MHGSCNHVTQIPRQTSLCQRTGVSRDNVLSQRTGQSFQTLRTAKPHVSAESNCIKTRGPCTPSVSTTVYPSESSDTPHLSLPSSAMHSPTFALLLCILSAIAFPLDADAGVLKARIISPALHRKGAGGPAEALLPRLRTPITNVIAIALPLDLGKIEIEVGGKP